MSDDNEKPTADYLLRVEQNEIEVAVSDWITSIADQHGIPRRKAAGYVLTWVRGLTSGAMAVCRAPEGTEGPK